MSQTADQPYGYNRATYRGHQLSIEPPLTRTVEVNSIEIVNVLAAHLMGEYGMSTDDIEPTTEKIIDSLCSVGLDYFPSPGEREEKFATLKTAIEEWIPGHEVTIVRGLA